MPTISINRDKLFERLQQTYTVDEFQELCFTFGIELDEVVTEVVDNVEKVTYKIEVPTNRYDLLCYEGLARSLAIFLGLETSPQFKRTPSANSELTLTNVTSNTKRIRPYIATAILRNVTFDEDSYASFIDLQEKLHQNLCRKRTLVAIGTHDLDTIQGPFLYDAVAPKDIIFKPLNENREFSAEQLMTYYATHNQLKHYLPIIQHFDLYPVITDSNGTVLSLPPIINGDHSKITTNTKNVFIECTGTDHRRVSLVLSTVVTMFSEYCNPKYEIEECLVKKAIRKVVKFPSIYSMKRRIHLKRVNNTIGIKITIPEVAKLLTKMGFTSLYEDDKTYIDVIIPPTRRDILHDCDLLEDIAIAYGYNKIEAKVPALAQTSRQIPLNRFTDILREIVAQAGFLEGLTFSLCSRDDISVKLNTEDGKENAVHVGNPKTLEFQVVRTTLLPGLLKTVSSNKMLPLPIKVFEVSDIVTKNKSADVGASNKRHLAAMYCSKEGNFEILHGLLDRIMLMLEIPWKGENGYYLQAADNPTYFPKRCASIMYNGVAIGYLGILHPRVLKHFDIGFPCSYMEFNVEFFNKIYS